MGLLSAEFPFYSIFQVNTQFVSSQTGHPFGHRNSLVKNFLCSYYSSKPHQLPYRFPNDLSGDKSSLSFIFLLFFLFHLLLQVLILIILLLPLPHHLPPPLTIILLLLPPLIIIPLLLILIPLIIIHPNLTLPLKVLFLPPEFDLKFLLILPPISELFQVPRFSQQWVTI